MDGTGDYMDKFRPPRIVLYGLMLSLHPWRPEIAAIGGFLVVIMSLVTLSFLITTPENWVPALGDSESGFSVSQRTRTPRH